MQHERIVPFPLNKINKRYFLEWTRGRELEDGELDSRESQFVIGSYFAQIFYKLQSFYIQYAKIEHENKLDIRDSIRSKTNLLGLENPFDEVTETVLKLSWMFNIHPFFWAHIADGEKIIDDRKILTLLGIADRLLTMQKDKVQTVAQAQAEAQAEGSWPVRDPVTHAPVSKIISYPDKEHRDWITWKVNKMRQLFAAVRMLTMYGDLNLSGVVALRIVGNEANRVRPKVSDFESQFKYGSPNNEALAKNRVVLERALAHRKAEYSETELNEIQRAYEYILNICQENGSVPPAPPNVCITNLSQVVFDDLMHCSAMAGSGSVYMAESHDLAEWRWLLLHEFLHMIFDVSEGYLWGGKNEAIVESNTETPLTYTLQRMVLAVLTVIVNRYAALSDLEVFDLKNHLQLVATELNEGRRDSEDQQLLNSLLIQLFGAQGILSLALMSNYNSKFSPAVLENLEFPLTSLQEMMDSYNRLHPGINTTMDATVEDRYGAIKFYQGLREWAKLPTLKSIIASQTPLTEVVALSDRDFADVLEQEELRMHLVLENLHIQRRKNAVDQQNEPQPSNEIGHVVDYKVGWSKMLQLWCWRKKRLFVPGEGLCGSETEFNDSYLSLVHVTESLPEQGIAATVGKSPALVDISKIEISLEQNVIMGKRMTNQHVRVWFIKDCLGHLEALPEENSIELYRNFIAQLYKILRDGSSYILLTGQVEKHTYRRMILTDENEDEDHIAMGVALDEIKLILAEHAKLLIVTAQNWETVANTMVTEFLPQRQNLLLAAIKPKKR